jgi:flagellar operon protein
MARLMNTGYVSNIKVNTDINQKNDSRNKKKPTVDFENLLKQEKKLKFSAHAQKRMESRNIKLNGDELKKIEEGVAKLRDKGCKDSIILSKDRAYVISVKNNTVVTVVDEDTMKNNIFTNIDSMTLI